MLIYGDNDDHGGSGRSSGDDNDDDVGASQCNDGLKQGAAALDQKAGGSHSRNIGP